MIWLHLSRDWTVWESYAPVWGLDEGQSVRVRHLGDRYYSVVLTLKDGVLDHPECWVRWGEHYRLVAPSVKTAVVWQDTTTTSGISLTVTVVDDGTQTLWVEGERESVMLAIPVGLSDWRLAPLPALSCLAVEGRGSSGRWLVVADVYRPTVLFEGMVDEWKGDESIVVVCTLADMRRHRVERTLGYRDGQWCTLAHTITCTDEHTYIPRLIPYLFAEALAVEAWEEAQSYVSPDLSEAWQDLRAYIGEVDSVAVPPVAADDLVGIVQKGEGRILKVTMQSDRISDVEWI